MYSLHVCELVYYFNNVAILLNNNSVTLESTDGQDVSTE